MWITSAWVGAHALFSKAEIRSLCHNWLLLRCLILGIREPWFFGNLVSRKWVIAVQMAMEVREESCAHRYYAMDLSGVECKILCFSWLSFPYIVCPDVFFWGNEIWGKQWNSPQIKRIHLQYSSLVLPIRTYGFWATLRWKTNPFLVIVLLAWDLFDRQCNSDAWISFWVSNPVCIN